MSFIVEENIPLPEPHRPKDIYPFKDMKVQDSFMFKECDKVRVCAAVSYWSDRLNQRYTIRKTGEKVYRVWRIA